MAASLISNHLFAAPFVSWQKFILNFTACINILDIKEPCTRLAHFTTGILVAQLLFFLIDSSGLLLKQARPPLCRDLGLLEALCFYRGIKVHKTTRRLQLFALSLKMAPVLVRPHWVIVLLIWVAPGAVEVTECGLLGKEKRVLMAPGAMVGHSLAAYLERWINFWFHFRWNSEYFVICMCVNWNASSPSNSIYICSATVIKLLKELISRANKF